MRKKYRKRRIYIIVFIIEQTLLEAGCESKNDTFNFAVTLRIVKCVAFFFSLPLNQAFYVASPQFLLLLFEEKAF